MALRTWLRSLRTNPTPRPARRPGTRLGVHQLEAREVPSADLVSALGAGSSAGNSISVDVAADAAGNSYMVGYFAGTVDFDPAGVLPGNADVLTAQGKSDGFVAKYAPNGRLAWNPAAGRAGGRQLRRRPG